MTGGIDLRTVLLLAAPGVPALLAAAWLVPRLRSVAVRVIPWAALPALLLALLHLIDPASAPSVEIGLLTTGVRIGLDDTGGAFLLLTALLWLAAGVFAAAYHQKDPKRDRFFAFFALAMAGNIGLATAMEMFTFYLFFALMTFSAYGLVAHRGDGPARRAGRIYIVLAFVGEVAILAAILTLGSVAGGPVPFGGPMEEAWSRLSMDPVLVGGPEGESAGARLLLGPLASLPVVAALLLGGLAVKVGLVPVHLWLPLAHPIAPTAASALLSGAMVKAGVLGWLRFAPMEPGLPGVAAAFLAVGVITAFYGVVAGVAQDDPKTVLAYSTVSQMGYLGVGLGIILLAPEAAPVAAAAITLYALHHAAAKGALFLSVGIADRVPRTGGGAGRWGLIAGVLLPVAAIAGAPATSGAQAKGVLKAALARLDEASADGSAAGWLTGLGELYPVFDVILLVAAAGTTILMARFLVTLRRRRIEGGEGGAGAVPWGLVLPWGGLVVAGALGPWWMPLVLPPAVGGTDPHPLSDLGSSLGPIVVGGALALVILRRPSLLGSVGRLRVPEGDLVVPVENLLGRVSMGARLVPFIAGRDRIERRAAMAMEGLRGWMSAAASRDPALMRDMVLGSLLFGLLTLLVLALAG